jgi:hypothetical protein
MQNWVSDIWIMDGDNDLYYTFVTDELDDAVFRKVTL